MIVDQKKLLYAMAVACMNPYDLCNAAGKQYQTYHRIITGHNAKTATVGKICKALNVDVKDIISSEGG